MGTGNDERDVENTTSVYTYLVEIKDTLNSPIEKEASRDEAFRF